MNHERWYQTKAGGSRTSVETYVCPSSFFPARSRLVASCQGRVVSDGFGGVVLRILQGMVVVAFRDERLDQEGGGGGGVARVSSLATRISSLASC